jgi:hypothetical protein
MRCILSLLSSVKHKYLTDASSTFAALQGGSFPEMNLRFYAIKRFHPPIKMVDIVAATGGIASLWHRAWSTETGQSK